MTRELMTLEDLSDYLQVPESRIKRLIESGQIPHHDTLGTPRFFLAEIDAWIKDGPQKDQPLPGDDTNYPYRGKPVLDYKLACSIVLVGNTPLERLPGFIRDAWELAENSQNGFLLRKEFTPLIVNFNDYLRLSCQLGLIDNVRVGKTAEYYLTDYARQICAAKSKSEVREAIRESVWDIVKNKKEELPQERHAVFLIWYYLKLKKNGVGPAVHLFDKGGEANSHPKIRFDYTKGLCDFIFGGDEAVEDQFFSGWEKIIS